MLEPLREKPWATLLRLGQSEDEFCVAGFGCTELKLRERLLGPTHAAVGRAAPDATQSHWGTFTCWSPGGVGDVFRVGSSTDVSEASRKN